MTSISEAILRGHCEAVGRGGWKETWDTDYTESYRTAHKWFIPLSDSVVNMCRPKKITGWWLGHPSEKYDFVNWDDDSNPIFLGK